MATTTVEQFLEVLNESRLLSEEQFVKAKRLLAQAPVEWPISMSAEILIEEGLLTYWQYRRLLAGETTFRVAKYKLIDCIGQGGMGAVFMAEHEVMGRMVAVKVLSRTRLDNPVAIARFRREVRASAKLDHPNIITAHDAGQLGDIHYLVMEYVEGRDLNDWIREYGKIPVPWACEFIRQAALGLDHANKQGLLHRDIKPANLLVTWPNRDELPVVKILDLGLARFNDALEDELGEIRSPLDKLRDLADTGLTQVGQIVGTPDYLSPEQIVGSRDIDVRSDIFSLGCTLFKLLTGQIPFSGVTVMDKIQARIAEHGPPPIPLRTLLPDAPVGLEEILFKMLAREPRHRYRRPNEVAQALTPYSLSSQGGWDLREMKLPRRATAEQITEETEEDPLLQDFLEKLDLVDDETQPGSDQSTLSDRAADAQARRRRRLAARDRVLRRRRRHISWGVAGVLALLVIAATVGTGALLLESLPDQTEAEVRLPAWPSNPRGLVFLWENADSANEIIDIVEGRFRVCKVSSRGAAGIGRHEDMILKGGAFLASGFNGTLAKACQESNQLTVEALITPSDLEQTGPARIITFSNDGQNRNFTLGQSGKSLILRLRTSQTGANGTPPEIELCQLEPGVPQHVLVTYQPGRLICYYNGRNVLETDRLQGDFSTWELHQLLFGDEFQASRPWQGRLEGIALFNRFFTPQQAALEYDNFSQRLLLRRSGVAESKADLRPLPGE